MMIEPESPHTERTAASFADENGDLSLAVATPPPPLNGNAEAAFTPRPFQDSAEFSLDEAILYIGNGKFQVKILVCVGIFMITTALQFSILSFLGFIVQCERPDWNVTDESAAAASTLVFFGMLVGTLFWGPLSDNYGRQPVMLLVACASAFFSALRAGAHSYEALLAIQFFLGASLSGFGTAFTYFVEFFPSSTRASWSMLLTSFWTMGIIAGIGLSWATELLGFKALVLVSTVPCLVNIAAMVALPRSPHFLVAKSKITEARDIMAAAGNLNNKPFPPGFVLVDRSPRRITLRAPIVAAFGPRYRRTTLLLYWIWFALGFIYYGIMMMSTNVEEARALMNLGQNVSISNVTGWIGYQDDSFCPKDGSRVFTLDDYTDSFIIAVAELPGIFIGWYFVDRIGRRWTTIMACLVFAVAIFVLGITPSEASDADIILLFIARGFSNTAYSVTWIYTPEVFPSSFRTTAFAISECFSHVGSMITPFVAQTMLANGLLPEACMIYCAAGILCAFASFSLKVETLGKEMATEEEDFPRHFSSRFDLELVGTPSTEIRPDFSTRLAETPSSPAAGPAPPSSSTVQVI